jgi:Zn-dependent protease
VNTRTVLDVLYYAVGLLIALMAHEYAHALAAVRLGDQSPRVAGRLTLNPKPHVDPFGSLLLPGILLLPVLFGRFTLPFAYAKPQPQNQWSLRKPDRDTILIALAGPAANLVLAFVFGGLIRLIATSGPVLDFLADCLRVTVVLAVMNLVPIPPFDGARVIGRFLPPRAREVFTNLEQYGALFILLIFFILPGPIFAFVGAIGNGICELVAGGACL